MKLYPNWKEIATKAWSIRFILIAGFFSGCEVALPFFSEAFPRNLFGALSGIFCAAAFIARLVAQKGM